MAGPVSEARIGVRVGALSVEAANGFGWAVAFGICSVSVYVLRGFFSFSESTAGGLVGWIPGVGKWVNSKLEKAEQKLTHWVGQAAAASEARMGDAFHASANELQSIGHEIYGQAIAYWQLAHWVYKLSASVVSGEAWQEIFHNTITAQKAGTRRNTRDLNKLGKALWKIAAALAALNLGALLKRLLANEAHIQKQIGAVAGGYTLPGTIALPRDYPSTRDIARQGERAAESTWKYLRSHPWNAATTAFAGAVAIAIGRLGGGWIRCSNWNKIGRGVCRMNPSQIESLLAGTLAIVGTISIVEFAKELQAIVGEGELAIHGLIRER
jgi:hypothetical protein